MSEELKSYRCPNCGGIISFDSSSQKLKCPSCGTQLDVDSIKAFNQLENEAAEDHFDWDKIDFEKFDNHEIHSYVCEACGGEIIGDASMASSSCPYCGNNVIVEKQFEGVLKPNYILPFKLDKDRAIEEMNKHLKGKILLPNDFKKKQKLTKITGVYVPYWLFDCDADGQFRYRAERSQSYRNGDYIITNTDHYLLYREGNMSFKNVPVDGSNKIEPKVLEAIEPFDFKELKPFNTAYLQGYLSDRFEADANEAKPRANQRIKTSMAQEISATAVGYTTVLPTTSNVNLHSGRIAYALLPVWILHAEYKGQKYIFAMNGETAKFAGDLPVDKQKFIVILLATLVISFVIILIIMNFLM